MQRKHHQAAFLPLAPLNDEGQIGLRVVGADNVARFVAVSIIEDGEKDW